MYALGAADANDAYPQMIEAIMRSGGEVNPRGTTCLEIHPAVIELTHPHRRLVTSWGRPVNVAFALAEVLWILAGRDDVAMLAAYNSTIADYSDDGTTFNAAYGKRLRRTFGFDQIEAVVRTLREDPDSRQATLVTAYPPADSVFILPAGDEERDKPIGLLRAETKDRACNVLSHAMIRGGRLDWMQVVRSNDAMWGTPYNWMQFTHLQEYVAARLGIPMGKYTHVVDSLHIYDRHWDEADRVEHFDLYWELGEGSSLTRNLPITAAPGCDRAMSYELEWAEKYEEWLRTDRRLLDGLLEDPGAFVNVVGPFWTSALLLWASYHAYRQGDSNLNAFNLALHPAVDPVYGAAQLRFYFAHRWGREDFHPEAMPDAVANHYPESVARWILGNGPSE